MSEVNLNIRLLAMTPNPIALLFAACRQCYSPKFAADMMEEKVDTAKQADFIRKVVASGHESPLEHVTFTFAVEGVSRALTHQLVRHRIGASYSQQSQRYVKETSFDYIVPPSIAEDKELKKEFLSVMKLIQVSYNSLLEKFNAKGKVGEQANQDVRFVLPQAAETKIVITMNARALIHFFRERCCSRAQWEIKRLAQAMLAIVQEKLSEVFGLAGAKCDALGYCPEGAAFTCGKYPLKENVLKKIK